MKGLSPEAMQHIIQRPKYIEQLAETRGGGKLLKLAETLKLMDRTQSLCFEEAEFGREYISNKAYIGYMKKKLVDLGVKKPRIVKDNGKIYIWSNDER